MTRLPDPVGGRLSLRERQPKPLRRQLDQLRADAQLQAARTTAAAHVTNVALHLVGGLTTQEELVVRANPLADARAKLLVDNFTAVAATIIAEFGL